MPSKQITVPVLAKLLDRSIPYAQSLIRTGAIRGRKGSNGWVTTSAAVEEYLARRANPSTKPVPKKK